MRERERKRERERERGEEKCTDRALHGLNHLTLTPAEGQKLECFK